MNEGAHILNLKIAKFKSGHKKKKELSFRGEPERHILRLIFHLYTAEVEMKIKNRTQISMKPLIIAGILSFAPLTWIDAHSNENNDAADPKAIVIMTESWELPSGEEVIEVQQLTSSDDVSSFAKDDTVDSSSDRLIIKKAEKSYHVPHKQD